ncbi:MAG: hypothetical protein RR650_05920 [Comamonas sp.]
MEATALDVVADGFFTAAAAAFGVGALALATAVVLEVLGFAVASGACLDFADFETGIKPLGQKRTHKGENASAT